jgi:hypothetical protein
MPCRWTAAAYTCLMVALYDAQAEHDFRMAKQAIKIRNWRVGRETG